jgi:hypothetical protein
VSTCKYRERRPATPTPTRLSPGRDPSIGLCSIRPVILPQGGREGLAEAAQQLVRLDPVHGEPFAVELQHRQPFAIALLELRIARDVDLVHSEPELALQRRQVLSRALAEMTVATDIQDESAQG